MQPRQPDVHMSEAKHYAFLHAVGVCALTGRTGPIEIEHQLGPEAYMDKPEKSVNEKPHYSWCWPFLSEIHQRRTMSAGQDSVLAQYGFDRRDIEGGPLVVSQVLFSMSCREDVVGAQRWLKQCAIRRLARLNLRRQAERFGEPPEFWRAALERARAAKGER